MANMLMFRMTYKHFLNFYRLFFYIAFIGLSPVNSAVVSPAERQQVRQYVQEILQHEDFKTHQTVTEWRYVDAENSPQQGENRSTDLPTELLRRLLSEGEENDAEREEFNAWLTLPTEWLLGFARFAEILLWAVLLLGLCALLWALLRNARWQFWRRNTKTSETANSKLEIILHNEEALSEHPAQAAWLYWQQGQARAAISLLYRASLQHLRQHEGLSLPDSATEGECLRLIKRTQTPTRSHYCARLTRTWQALAYAHQVPQEAEVRRLCNDWDRQFLLLAQ